MKWVGLACDITTIECENNMGIKKGFLSVT